MRKTISTAALLLSGLALLGQAAAQDKRPATRPGDDPPAIEVSTRVYDVGDLVRPARDYPLAPPPAPPAPRVQNGEANAQANNHPPAAPEASRQEQEMDAVTSLIRDTLAADTWKENGGSVGTMRALPSGTAIIVTHTDAVHQQITRLLAVLRKQSGVRTMLSVRASWVLLDPKQVEALYDAAKPAKPLADGGPADATLPEIPDAILDRDKLYCQAQTTCFNGQTVAIQSGREWSAVTGMSPVVGTQAVGFDAKVEQVRSGVTLQLTPQLTGEDGGVVLDLHSSVTESRQPTTQPIRVIASSTPPVMDAAKMSDLTQASIDRTDVLRQSFATTARVPLGKRVLVAGMTLQPAVGEATPRHLYLVVRADAVR